MKHYSLWVLSLLLFLMSCEQRSSSDSAASLSYAGSSTSSWCTPEGTSEEMESEIRAFLTTPLPNLASSFESHVELIGFTDTQAGKYQEAISILKQVIGSEEFRDRVLNYNFNNCKQFADNKGMTNLEIYQSILEAAEELYPSKNNAIDLQVELYYADNSVIGYTDPWYTQIFVNLKFFNQYAPASVAGNLMHEWLHKLGYDHDVAKTAKRPYSVPYAIGYILSDLGRSL